MEQSAGFKLYFVDLSNCQGHWGHWVGQSVGLTRSAEAGAKKEDAGFLFDFSGMNFILKP